MGFKSFQVAEPERIWGEWCAWRGHGSSTPFPVPCPMHLSHLAVPELYSFVINQ